MQALIPWQWVRVVGYSMTPTLLPGDWVLVRHGAAVRPGAIVLGRFRQRPDLAVIKRAVGERDGGWLLASDNARGQRFTPVRGGGRAGHGGPDLAPRHAGHRFAAASPRTAAALVGNPSGHPQPLTNGQLARC